MRKILLLLFAFGLIPGFAQNISVSSFKSLNTDLTANTAGTMEKDQNGETAALIKVVTTQTGFTFDGGALGIVKLQAPTPILGEADINSSPGMADIYIDGKKVGQTPQLISDLIVGRHSITLEKKGYQSETRYIDIKEDDILNVRISLSEEKTSQNKTKKSDKSTNKAQGYFIPNL